MGKIIEEKNPYTRDFGTIPSTYIERTVQQDDITRSFISEVTDDKVYFIIGQRGFGKSSLLRATKEQIARDSRWIVIELRSNNDNLIHELAASLYSIPVLKAKFSELELDFSLIGVGVSIGVRSKKTIEISSEEVAIKKMLEVVAMLNKKVLVAIDEISNTPAIRDFCGLFNVCKGSNLPMYLLMDGLYKNTTALENVSDLTFLKRVEKLEVNSLDNTEMFNSYKHYLHLEDADNPKYALKLVEKSKGYPYAFQLIGFYSWLWLKEDENIIKDFDAFEEKLNAELDRNLSSYVYSTLWTEISPVEQDILSIMACFNLSKVGDIREKYEEIFPERAAMTSANFSKYRDKLIKMKFLKSTANTMLEFNLPRFDVFAIMNRNLAIEL